MSASSGSQNITKLKKKTCLVYIHHLVVKSIKATEDTCSLYFTMLCYDQSTQSTPSMMMVATCAKMLPIQSSYPEKIKLLTPKTIKRYKWVTYGTFYLKIGTFSCLMNLMGWLNLRAMVKMLTNEQKTFIDKLNSWIAYLESSPFGRFVMIFL